MLIISCVGLAYALAMPALSQFILAKLHKERFVEYIAYSKSVSRLASIASTCLVGLAMSFGLTPSNLLLVLAAAGLLFVFAMYFWRPAISIQ